MLAYVKVIALNLALTVGQKENFVMPSIHRWYL